MRRLGGARDLSSEVLLEAGLATRGDDGTVRDRFRGRITFPIHDLQGRYIGFGARVVPSDARAGEQAKYLNTAETPIYRKHEVLYNMHRARQAVAKAGEVFVVEGYTDVIGLAQAGLPNVVATCGTALGEKHFEQLSRFAERAILSFDSDEAGARAAERAFEFQEKFPITAVVLIMPEGLDPADFVAKHGADAVRAAAASARPLVEYMVRRTVDRHDLSTIEGQSAAVSAALPMLERLSDPVRRSEYAGMLADLAGVSHASVVQSLTRHLRRQAGGGGRDDEARHRPRARRARGAPLDRARRRRARSRRARSTSTISRRTKLRASFVALRDADWDAGAIAGGADPDLASRIAVAHRRADRGRSVAGLRRRGRRPPARLRAEGAQRRAPRATPEVEPDDRCRIRRVVPPAGRGRRRAAPIEGAVTLRLLPYTVAVVTETPQDHT